MSTQPPPQLTVPGRQSQLPFLQNWLGAQATPHEPATVEQCNGSSCVAVQTAGVPHFTSSAEQPPASVASGATSTPESIAAVSVPAVSVPAVSVPAVSVPAVSTALVSPDESASW